MIIPPSPTTPRSPLRRAARAAGLVAAPALLAVVVAIGLTGPRPEPPATPPPVLPATPAPVGTPTPVAPSTSAPSVPTTTPPPGIAADTWPSDALRSFAGLGVVGPSDALALRAAGSADGPVVVRGHLKLDAPSGSCEGGVLGPLGPWCVRTGILAERAWAVTGADSDALPGHLHVTLPEGVRAPGILGRMAVAVAGPPLPVVLVGRFTGTRCDPADLAWCEEPFVVDRVTWADGARAALTPLAEDPLQTGRRRANPLELAVPARQTPLVAVLAWPDTIARLDPATAGAARDLEASEPAWYLRVLEGEGQGPSSHGGTPAVHWVLLDERFLQVLATGDTAVTADPTTVPVERTASDPFPGVADTLGVRTVGATRAAVTGGVDGPIAVAGYLRDVRPAGACMSDRPGRDALCARVATLDPRARPGEGGAGIRLRIPPGVRLPGGAAGTGSGPMAVVVLARPRLDGAGCPATPACEPTLEADRITWAGGVAVDVHPVIDPALGAAVRRTARPTRADAERLATGWSGTVLVSALVPRGRVAELDPVAAAILGSRPAGDQAVWYVRALETRYGSMRFPPGDVTPRISWVVADAISGEALASGTQ